MSEMRMSDEEQAVIERLRDTTAEAVKAVRKLVANWRRLERTKPWRL